MSKSAPVTESMLTHLPEPVQRYLHYSGVMGTPWINTVHLRYQGQFRLGADKPWMAMTADQVYTVDPPGFQWKARFKLLGLPLLAAVDTYADGQGHMFGKLAGMVTMFDARDKQLLQGTMLRYLQEMLWFPTAYLSDYITWQAVDDHAADITFTYAGEQVTGRMFFDDAGRVLSFRAQRYREENGQYHLNTWSTPMTDYAVWGGLRVPCSGSGVWELPDADLVYIRLQVTTIEYNVPIRQFQIATTTAD